MHPYLNFHVGTPQVAAAVVAHAACGLQLGPCLDSFAHAFDFTWERSKWRARVAQTATVAPSVRTYMLPTT